jgi:hypothetical protein
VKLIHHPFPSWVGCDESLEQKRALSRVGYQLNRASLPQRTRHRPFTLAFPSASLTTLNVPSYDGGRYTNWVAWLPCEGGVRLMLAADE